MQDKALLSQIFGVVVQLVRERNLELKVGSSQQVEIRATALP